LIIGIITSAHIYIGKGLLIIYLKFLKFLSKYLLYKDQEEIHNSQDLNFFDFSRKFIRQIIMRLLLVIIEAE